MKKLHQILLIQALFITILAVCALGQQHEWIQLPNQGAGGRISQLTTNRYTGDLYVVIEDSIFYTQSKGENKWERLRISDSVRYIDNIRFDKQGNIYVLTYSTDSLSGILKSTDKGNTWTNNYSRKFYIESFEVDEKGSIYILSNWLIRKPAGSNQEEVLINDLNYDAYERMLTALPNGIFFGHKNVNNFPTLHHISYDSCTTWTPVSDSISAKLRTSNKLDSIYRTYHLGFPQSSVFMNSQGVLFGAFEDNYIIACYSYDTAKTWIAIDTFSIGYSHERYSFSFFEGADKQMHIIDSYNRKLYSSNGNYQSWNEVKLPEDYFFSPIRALFENGNYYVFADISLYKNTAINNIDGWKICGPTVGYPRKIIEMNDGSLFLSWQFRDESDNVFSSGTTYRYSTDNQLSFVVDTQLHYNMFNTNEYVTSFARDSSGGILLGTHSQMLYRTTDNGHSWSGDDHASYSGFRNTYVAVSQSNNIFIAHLQFGISFSTDNGVTWHHHDEKNETRRTFSLCTNTNGYVFAGTQNAVYRLKELDTIWTRCPNGLLGSMVSALYSTRKGVVYAGGGFQGMYRSYDNGDSWEQINQGLDSLAVTDIVGDVHDNIYISTKNGVYVLYDSAKSWKLISEKLPNQDVRCLSITKEGSLFVGTNGDGLFKYKSNLYTLPPDNKPNFEPFIKIYPSVSSSLIRISLDKYAEPSVLHIYNCLGKSVAMINYNGYSGDTSFDAGTLASGVYYIGYKGQRCSFVVLK
jgi:photosystem II stability/assembly factor-like uncharacterized protein